jgi:methionyl-tRNA formyltransferase
MDRKRIVFMGSKPIGYCCLQYLISACDNLDITIAGILTQRRREFDGYNDLAALADANGIPVLDGPDDIPDCDILYSVQYHRILKQEHIDKAKQVAVNLHMAPLPEYRGSNQFSFAILENKEEFGTTIHVMDRRIDHGDILFQKRFPIPENCWVHQLYELTFDASSRLFKQTLAHIVKGNYQRLPQQDLVSSKGTSLHFRHEIADIKRIDLDWDGDKISRHIRAGSMPGFEPPYCDVNGTKVYFTTAITNG